MARSFSTDSIVLVSFVLIIKNMNELQINRMLYKRLEEYGAINWHKSRGHSFYIKFRDVRLGSIRIASHKGRDRYRYTYEIYTCQKDIEKEISKIVESIKTKISTIQYFDPQKYVVFDPNIRQYKEVHSIAEYKDYILKKTTFRHVPPQRLTL